jgi:hypothetical protein
LSPDGVRLADGHSNGGPTTDELDTLVRKPVSMDTELLEPPAMIVIIGAGPAGLEAALYARTMGYRVVLVDAGPTVGGEIRELGSTSLERPFRHCCSRLGLAALRTQDLQYAPPAMEEVLDGRSYLRRYLEPLALVDLLSDSIRLETKVTRLLRNPEYDAAPDDDDQHCEFLVEVEGPPGTGSMALPADSVIDAGGASSVRPEYWAGLGGEWDAAAGRPSPIARLPIEVDGVGPSDCRDLRTTTPYLYVLGARSWGPGHDRCLIHALEQIGRLFAMFADRPEFDLYRSVR